jgi:hypothetical protein
MALPAGIDNLKASISRRGGMAKANRFAVYISHPTKKVDLINTDLNSLLGNAASRLIQGQSPNLGSFFEDPRDVFLFCESATLPGRQVATNDFFTGMKGYKKPYAYLNDDVTLTFNLTNDYYMRDYFKTWIDEIFPYTNGQRKVNYKNRYCTDLIIQQMGSNDWIPAKSVVLKNAFPVTLSSINLSNSSENTISQITITFAFDDWEDQGVVTGASQGILTGLDAVTNSINTVRNIGKVLGF